MKTIFLCLAKIFLWQLLNFRWKWNIKYFMKAKHNSLSDDNCTNVWTFLLRQEVLRKAEGQAPTALCPRLSKKSCHSQAVACPPGCYVFSLWFHPCYDSDAWWWLGTMGKWGGPELGCVLLCSRAGCALCGSLLEKPKICSPIVVSSSPPWDCKDNTGINVFTQLSAMTPEN